VPALTLDHVALATGARRLGPAEAGERPVARVVVDSRAVCPGDLFVALPGARTDGHRFVAEVAAAGAAGALCVHGRGPRPEGFPVLTVDDTVAALGRLARHQLGRLGAEVLGVTGTVGKTTAKDFLGALLGGAAAGVHVAPASYNSEIGLPLSILGAAEGTRLLVLEYGVNAPGEMERLVRIARPDEAWLTALTEVHLEGMGDFPTLVREKARLLAAVPEAGRAWLGPGAVAPLAAHAAAPPAPVIACAGLAEPGLVIHARRPLRWVVEDPRLGRVVLPVIAPHEAETALVAARIAALRGVAPELLAERLAALRRPAGRLELRRRGALTVLDDGYNSSPAALDAALAVWAEWGEWEGVSDRHLVLGPMLELGAAHERLHRAAGRRVAALRPRSLVVLGAAAAPLAAGALEAGLTADAVLVTDDPERAASWLAGRFGPRPLLLLKGSRAAAVERVIQALSSFPSRPVALEG